MQQIYILAIAFAQALGCVLMCVMMSDISETRAEMPALPDANSACTHCASPDRASLLLDMKKFPCASYRIALLPST